MEPNMKGPGRYQMARIFIHPLLYERCHQSIDINPPSPSFTPPNHPPHKPPQTRSSPIQPPPTPRTPSPQDTVSKPSSP
ncbi:hypothetical protein M419DRAFT_127600 [Trichoderma reesei RUT C-30]|uniref:Uncharacterized protein n=1 Tax=Hypocrea jecorina (strain ATCC 56765 / BCRC 32924 / NRRL 11460 / Rut C-30) TaxID=1344414 RepID=A0A024SG18_HYPJR|nr:hypothetical protein M419DRAFT_127600 [Trichoderma reesei RUT C-30]